MAEETKLALVNAKDLTLVGTNSLNPAQLKFLLQRTPKQYVKTRPAKGGGKWEYVTGGYVRKMLNLMFGWNWDFEIVNEQLLIDAGEVVVKGKLTCRTSGNTIVKMQYGNKDIMFKKGTKNPLSIGNDMKAAATDALKKCAAELGIAADIYNKEDFREIRVDAGLDKPEEDHTKSEEYKRQQSLIEHCTTLEELEFAKQNVKFKELKPALAALEIKLKKK